MKLANQVAIITGAGRNIGEDTAKLFAQEGAAVAVVDMDRGRAEKVANAITSAGGRAKPYICDVSQEDQIVDTVKAVAGDWGRLDILINNVAISDNKHVLDVTKAEWDHVLAVCLTAPMLLSKYAAKEMIAGGRGGKIVNISSTSGHFGRPRAIAYTTAKAGVINLTRSLAIQLAKHNIRVNCVVPNKIGSPVGKDEFNPGPQGREPAQPAGRAHRSRARHAVPLLRRFGLHRRRRAVRRRRLRRHDARRRCRRMMR